MWLVRERQREEELMKQKEANGIHDNTEDTHTDEDDISLWNRIYYSKVFRGLLVIIAVAIIIPIFIVLFLDFSNPDFDETHTCSVETGYQIPCGEQNTTYGKCSSLKCCFNETDFSCFHKVRSYYQYAQTEEDSNTNLFKPVEDKTPFGKDNMPVYLSIKKERSYKLAIILSTEKDDNKKNKGFFENEEYTAQIFTTSMGVEVNRSKTNEQLLSSMRGPTIISERYWEWTIDLFADHLFGMDFLRFPDNTNTTKIIYKNKDDQSSIARFMSYSSGKYHGLEVEHSGPLQVTVTEAKLLVFKTFSGTRLTFRLTTGPTPVDVLRQLRDNEHPDPVPYWVLGVHVCRDGDVTNTDAILKEFNSFDRNLPYDSDCIHENLFSLSKNKGNAKIDAAVAELKTRKKFVMSLSPQVLYDAKAGSNYKKAEELQILYTKDKKIVLGKYINKTVAFPDYSSPKTEQWFKEIYDTELAHLEPDGLILRSNWPANDNYKMENIEDFQYMPKTLIEALSNTLPWDSLNAASVPHIDTHNSYGLSYTNVVSSQTKSNIIMSSAFSQGSQYPAHIQNINASWVNFKEVLRKTLSHSLFGGQLFSVPVCGDTSKFNKDLNQAVCLRWYLTAATMPLFRITSDLPRRDPSVYDKDAKHIKNIMVHAIEIRYSLLPYYYTVLSENLPMVRPLFINFPNDNNTFDLDEEYMIGEGLLVAQPGLFPTPNMQVYLPKVPGGWYEFWGGLKFPQVGWVTIPVVESDLVAFVQAGKIIPMQDGTAKSAEESLKNPLKLVIAFYCTKEGTCSAKGTLYSKGSITVLFQAENQNLILINAEQCQTADFEISTIQVYKNDERFLKVLSANLKFCVKLNANVLLPNLIQ